MQVRQTRSRRSILKLNISPEFMTLDPVELQVVVIFSLFFFQKSGRTNNHHRTPKTSILKRFFGRQSSYLNDLSTRTWIRYLPNTILVPWRGDVAERRYGLRSVVKEGIWRKAMQMDSIPFGYISVRTSISMFLLIRVLVGSRCRTPGVYQLQGGPRATRELRIIPTRIRRLCAKFSFKLASRYDSIPYTT